MEVDAHPVAGIEEELQRVEVQVQSEGLLLYVSQATYEPGISPLSTWVPTQFGDVAVLDLFERCVYGGSSYFCVRNLTESIVPGSCRGGCRWGFQE